MKINILNIKIDALTYNEALEKVEAFLNSKNREQRTKNNPLDSARGKQIITANPEIVLEAWQNDDYRQLINSALLVVPDGVGLLWAAKFLSLKSHSFITSFFQVIISGISLIIYPKYCQEALPERIAGVDLMEKICELTAKKGSPRFRSGEAGWKVYLLGAEEGIAEKCALKLKERYLNLNVVAAESGSMPHAPCPMLHAPCSMLHENAKEINSLIDRINNAQADILFVAFGAPKQDFFIQQILPQLPSVKLAMGVGGAFDFISGKVKRAPLIYQNLGVEWLFRLFHQPWRFFRILNATIRFMWNVVKYKHGSKN